MTSVLAAGTMGSIGRLAPDSMALKPEAGYHRESNNTCGLPYEEHGSPDEGAGLNCMRFPRAVVPSSFIKLCQLAWQRPQTRP